MEYNHNEVEKKWQSYWEENKVFETDVWDFSKPKFYAIDMFPYPSGQGLHVGHPEGITATDIICRMRRMQGYNVLHPMGFDSFGLPAEQYAINTGHHPEGFTQENIKTFTKQLKMLGFGFDWSKTISTADPKFYKWTQWIFKQLFLDGLAKEVDMPVNWCEELQTVLANDEVIDGKSERGGFPVIKRNMRQWVLDIPKYAEKLLDGLNEIDFPESTKEMQRNWIGKSVGAEITFKVDQSDLQFTVFTTRADTLFGATYCVLAPEHDIVSSITTKDQLKEVQAYLQETLSKSESERTDSKEKTGVFTGSYAINPVNQKKMPIFISDYVLKNYGFGAIMAVPAHDTRDYAFAKKFNLEIIPILEGGNIEEEAFTEDGIHINSGFLNGKNKEDATQEMIYFLEGNHFGKKKITYRLREWIFARQRYWGEPIPIIHFGEENVVLDDRDLPLILPVLEDYRPKNGNAPLENAGDWLNVKKNGKIGKRETSTMPGSAGSSWYFLRYLDPNNENQFANPKLLKHWLPVDLYIGGSEHAVGHLLYSRFWNHYLYDKGFVPVKEPFKKLFHQGMILGENNEKMSKSRGNVINPDDIILKYGADSLRLYEMFMGPLEASLPWSNNGLEGARKFLDRVYRLFTSEEYIQKITNEPQAELEKIYHKTVKKVTHDYENLCFNTAISQMMIFVNEAYKAEKIYIGFLEGFLKMLYCITPHLGEELWNLLGHDQTIAFSAFPKYDEEKTKDDIVTVVVQVGGKVRDKLEVEANLSKEILLERALASDKVRYHLDGKEIVKTIVLENKLVNIVLKG